MGEFISEEEQKKNRQITEHRYREAAKTFMDAVNEVSGDITYGEIMRATGLSVEEVCEATVRTEFYQSGDILRCRLKQEDGSRPRR